MGALIIISGGPGSGKTTLLEELNSRGFQTFPEIPREIIEKNLNEGTELLPWVDLQAFAGECYRRMVHQKAGVRGAYAFVDRAIGDIIAYMHIGGLDGEKFIPHAVVGYENTVFLMKPSPDIYIQDEVRPHSFGEALEIHKEIERVYRTLGFSIVCLPAGSTAFLADLVVKKLGL